jgi:hypothetical protein
MTPEEQNVMNSELFERLRKLETSVALLSQDVKAQKDAFDIHDKREMDKFSQVEESIKRFDTLLKIGLGIVLASSDSVWTILLKIVGI